MRQHATPADAGAYLSPFQHKLLALHNAQVDGDTDRERQLTAEIEAYLQPLERQFGIRP